LGTIAAEILTAIGPRDFAVHPLGFPRFAAFVVPITQLNPGTGNDGDLSASSTGRRPDLRGA